MKELVGQVVDAGEFESPIGRVQLMIVYYFIAQSLSLSPLLSSRYALNDVDRDVKHQIINSSLFTAHQATSEKGFGLKEKNLLPLFVCRLYGGKWIPLKGFATVLKKEGNYEETKLPSMYMYLKSLEKMRVILKRVASRWLK